MYQGKQNSESKENNTTQRKGVALQKKNNTGLPDNLKSGIENLSGHSMDDVKVHYNSSKPATLQAHAYAQGNEIHLAPNQEKHLPHEAWHVVQQKQGRVRPTTQQGNVQINDDTKLEKEADVMGAKAIQMKSHAEVKTSKVATNFDDTSTYQLFTAAYTKSDYGTEPNLTDFNDQVIINILHSRDSIPSDVKKAVVEFDDNGDGTTYNHYVPYGKIAESLIDQLINKGKTRIGIVKLLMSHLKNIPHVVTPGLTINPLKSVINFNTWVDAAIVAIADSPNNIYLGPHEGDGSGTKVDIPIDPSVELSKRLKMAALAYRIIGLSW